MYKTACAWQVCVKWNEEPGLVGEGVVDELRMEGALETIAA